MKQTKNQTLCWLLAAAALGVGNGSAADQGGVVTAYAQVWGLQWFTNDLAANGLFPQYYKQVGGKRVAVAASDVPADTKPLTQEFELAKPGVPYTSPRTRKAAQPTLHRADMTRRGMDVYAGHFDPLAVG